MLRSRRPAAAGAVDTQPSVEGVAGRSPEGRQAGRRRFVAGATACRCAEEAALARLPAVAGMTHTLSVGLQDSRTRQKSG